MPGTLILPRLSICLTLAGCGDPAAPPASVASVEVAAPAQRLVLGETMQLTATVRDDAGRPLAGRSLQWSSSDEAVATVTGTGLVTGVAYGPATITATSGARSGQAALTVVAHPSETFLAFSGAASEFISQGRSHRYTRENATLSPAVGRFGGGRNNVQIDVSPGGWILTLAAPAGQHLQVGTYPGAVRWPFQSGSQPGLSLVGENRACGWLTGSFTIHEIAFTTANGQERLRRLRASFEQYCEGVPPVLNGEISFPFEP